MILIIQMIFTFTGDPWSNCLLGRYVTVVLLHPDNQNEPSETGKEASWEDAWVYDSIIYCKYCFRNRFQSLLKG